MGFARFLTLGVIITVLTVIWNFFHPGTVRMDEYHELHEASKLHISLEVWGALMALNYFANWINIVNEWDRRPVMRFGRYVRTLGPGISLVEPIFNRTLQDVTVQDVVMTVPVDEIQTKDNIGINLVAALTYCVAEDRVKDTVVAVQNMEGSLQERALTTLADVGATNDLDKFLEHREQFCTDILSKLIDRVSSWGVTVKAFEIKAFGINDEQIALAIALKARAKKEGEAEIVRATLQKQVAEALNDAANAYTEKGRWLKGVETLIELGRSAQNNTIMIPTDLTVALSNMLNAPK